MSPDRAERVEDLTTEVESRREAAFQRLEVHFLERHAAAGDLGLLETFIARPWEDIGRELLEERDAFGAPQVRDAAIRRHLRFEHQLINQPLRQRRAEQRRDMAHTAGEQRLPRGRVKVAPLHANHGRTSTLRPWPLGPAHPCDHV